VVIQHGLGWSEMASSGRGTAKSSQDMERTTSSAPKPAKPSVCRPTALLTHLQRWFLLFLFLLLWADVLGPGLQRCLQRRLQRDGVALKVPRPHTHHPLLLEAVSRSLSHRSPAVPTRSSAPDARVLGPDARVPLGLTRDG